MPSIIIPSHNQLPLLKNALHSLEAQTWSLDKLEVVVVDDGSEDGTGDFLRSYSGKLRLHPIFHREAKGRAGARNAGLQAATGDPIILLDGDMEVAPQFVEAHVSEGRGEAAVLGRVLYHPDIRRSALTRYYPSRGAWKHQLTAESSGRYFVTLNASLPRWAYEKVGLFDENFRGYGGEDLDYGMRLQKAGVPFRTSARALSFHHHLRTLPEILGTLEKYGEEAIPYLIQKHPELLDEMKLSLAMPLKCLHPKSPAIILKNLSVRAISWGVFYHLFRRLAMLLEPFWIPGWVMNYLIFRNYSKGYIGSLKSRDSSVVKQDV